MQLADTTLRTLHNLLDALLKQSMLSDGTTGKIGSYIPTKTSEVILECGGTNISHVSAYDKKSYPKGDK